MPNSDRVTASRLNWVTIVLLCLNLTCTIALWRQVSRTRIVSVGRIKTNIPPMDAQAAKNLVEMISRQVQRN